MGSVGKNRTGLFTLPVPAPVLGASAHTGCKGQLKAVPAFRKQFLWESEFLKGKNTNPVYLTKGTLWNGGRKEDTWDRCIEGGCSTTQPWERERGQVSCFPVWFLVIREGSGDMLKAQGAQLVDQPEAYRRAGQLHELLQGEMEAGALPETKEMGRW